MPYIYIYMVLQVTGTGTTLARTASKSPGHAIGINGPATGCHVAGGQVWLYERRRSAHVFKQGWSTQLHTCLCGCTSLLSVCVCVCVCVCTRGEDNTCQCVGTFVMHQVAHWDAVSLKKQQVLPFLETRPELQVATLPTHGLTQI